MKLKDLVKEVDDAVRRRDPHVQVFGKTWPVVDYPGGVRKVVLELTQGVMTIEALGGGERTIPGQVVRNFNRRVLRIYRGRNLHLDGAIDGVYVRDVELECTKIVLAVKTPAIASLIF
jgi:hypothetical protein